ncbi:hypothetical protein FRX31_026256 [Thalictrum thalictroides]|uniref:Uncharacterized protein n=1 Tax=Thalictrum thalictroides TaxID=46969 RepID=A0A7J6VGB7_THATH|nr:hypothetical protein FRX31_026256 [Thalictrum thalictroides]
MYDRHRSRIRDNYKLCDLITARQWRLPVTTNPELKLVFDSIMEMKIQNNSEPDKLIWTPHPQGRFTIKTTYEVIRQRRELRPWTQIIWGEHIRPRHSFVLWLAIQDTLPMQEKLVEWNKINISNCYLCSQGLQAMDQTQMPIHYPNRSRPRARTVWYPEICSTRLWGHVMEWCGVKRLVDQAPAEWIWIFHAFKGKSLKKLMIQSALAATVYWIWSERNARMYGGSIEQRPLFHLITRDVTLRLAALEKRHKDTPDNQFAAARIGRVDLITLRPRRMLQWELPAKGWHALNSVGSLMSNKVSYGGIIRDETGAVNLAFCASSNERSILYLELMGIAKGIEVAMTLNISKLHIRTDSMMSTGILLK